MEQKHLSEFSLKDASEYRNKLQLQLERLNQEIIYWSGICDFLKDKEYQEQQKIEQQKVEQEKK